MHLMHLRDSFYSPVDYLNCLGYLQELIKAGRCKLIEKSCDLDKVKPVPVKYLAICQYENDKLIYVFLCNEKLEVEQDSAFDTIEEAKTDTALKRKLKEAIQWIIGKEV